MLAQSLQNCVQSPPFVPQLGTWQRQFKSITAPGWLLHHDS